MSACVVARREVRDPAAFQTHPEEFDAILARQRLTLSALTPNRAAAARRLALLRQRP